LRNVVNRAKPIIVRRGDLLALTDAREVDADHFEKAARDVLAKPAAPDLLNEALAVVLQYGGDFLPTDPYEEWAALPRERLRGLFLSLSDLTTAIAASEDKLDVALTVIESAIRYDPYDDHRYDLAAAMLERAGRVGPARSMRSRAEAVRTVLGV